MLMKYEDWQKVITESKKHTQKVANNIFLARRNNIVAQLLNKLGDVDIILDSGVKKGRPKKPQVNNVCSKP